MIFSSLILSGAAAATAVNNSTIYVSTQGNDSWDGFAAAYNNTTGYGPKATITNATGTVTNNGTVYIESGNYTGTGDYNITINNNITVTGENQNETILNGQNLGTLFTINPNITVTFQDLSLLNGNATTIAGAILNQGTLSLDNCTFTDNTASDCGGGIYNNGILTIIDDTFNDNSAMIYQGGAIYNNGTLNVINTLFSNNTITNLYGAGGAIFNGNISNIDNCSFTNNNGTSVTANGLTNINNCTFTNNNDNVNGGAIWNTDGELNINNCTFTDNTASKFGGAISNVGWNPVDNSTVNINNCIFNNNSVLNGYGGAISNYGFYANATTTITGSTFNNNSALNGYGGAIDNYGRYANASTIITGCNFTYNIANYGGAISNRNSTENTSINLSNSSLDDNTATMGGAFFNDGNTSNINYCQIINNNPVNNTIYSDSGLVDANYNWWGSNNNPSNYVYGNVNLTNWLILNINSNASSSNIYTITANLLYDDQGQYHDPLDGCLPNGIPVIFTSSIGNLQPTSTTLINGQAKTIFTSNSSGLANITATLDNQTVTTNIMVTLPTTLTISSTTGITGSTIPLTATLTNSNNPVSGATVSFNVNGQTVGTATTGLDGIATYSYLINLPVGIYNIIATYTGNNTYASSNSTNNTLTVNSIPTILTVNNATGTYGNNVNLTATLKDNQDNLLSGETIYFEVNGSKVGNVTTNNQYTATLPYTLNLTPNKYVITATYNGDASYTKSTGNAVLNVELNPTNITVAPVHNFAGKNVTLSANITDYYGNPVNTGQVNFTIGNATPITVNVVNGSATTIWTIPDTWTTGNYTITANYLETSNYLASSNNNTITVLSPLNITQINPTNNSNNIPNNQMIKVTFNELIKAGNMDIQLSNSNGTAIDCSIIINGTILTIKPSKLLTNDTKYTLILHTGSITGLDGNPLTLWSSNFSTGPNPTVKSINPSNGATNISTNKVITVIFSEPIKKGNMNIQLMSNNRTSVSFNTSINGTDLIITPNKLLTEDTKYTLTLHTSSITDLAGNSLALWTSSFSTGPLPKVTSVNPASNGSNIILRFNEPIKAGNDWIVLTNNKGISIPFKTKINGDTLTITPNTKLTNKTKYNLTLHTGSLTDLAGNPLALTTSTFTTNTT